MIFIEPKKIVFCKLECEFHFIVPAIARAQVCLEQQPPLQQQKRMAEQTSPAAIYWTMLF